MILAGQRQLDVTVGLARPDVQHLTPIRQSPSPVNDPNFTWKLTIRLATGFLAASQRAE
jgi:hypothetical protein